MFSSIKTKISFFITIVMVATAAAIMYFTHRDVGHALSRAEEASAKNVLRLVELNIQGEYQNLVSDRVETISRRKRGLKSQTEVAASVLEQYAILSHGRLISEEKAKEIGLNWLRSVALKKETLFAFNQNGLVIAHPDSDVESMSLSFLRDLKGRHISKVMSADLLAPRGDFAVFDWKKPGEEAARRKLGYFVPIRDWQWTVAAVIDMSDLEAESQKKLKEITEVLRETFAKIQITQTGSAFIFNGEKDMVIPPQANHDLDYESIKNSRTGNLLLDDLKRAAGSDDKALSFVVPRGDDSRGMEAYVQQFKALDWYIAVAAPVREIQKPAKVLVARQSIIISMIFLGSLMVAYLLVRQVSRPLNMLASYARELPKSDFTAEQQERDTIDAFSVKFKDEVGRLAESFIFMRAELKKTVKNLIETTGAKERIESELQIAHDIQMSFIPKIFPPFPERHEIEIYALIEPAKEVGGDLYDFFFIDNDHLCFAVGDAAGKGVPASLFMAVSQTLVEVEATRGLSSADVLTRVNRNLSMENPSCMFITLFLGILNVRTGELEYSNGGHEPPFVIRANGGLTTAELTNGVPLGLDEGYIYDSKKLALQKGDTVFLYTDGVTEAMDSGDQLFSPERLEQTLARYKDKNITDIIHGLRSEIGVFSEGTPQSDDITMLALKFCE